MLGSTMSFSPSEEQQSGVNPVLGHGRRGVRNRKKTVTEKELEEGDTESVCADLLRVDLAFRRRLSGPSGFICLGKCNRSRARPAAVE